MPAVSDLITARRTDWVPAGPFARLGMNIALSREREIAVGWGGFPRRETTNLIE